MKKCCRCGVIKDTQDFNKDKRRPDGLQPMCSKCNAMACARYRNSAKGKITKAKCQLAYRARHPERIKAREMVHQAIRYGDLVRPTTCSHCGQQCKPQGHHYKGYDPQHWYDVQWVCRECHTEVENQIAA